MSKIILPAATFIWCGLILGISFLEAPLKFQAPNMTLELGLGIGQLVFTALNRIEIVLALLIAVCYYFLRPGRTLAVTYGIVGFILLLQTVWLLPALSARTDVYLSGQVPPESSLHFIFIFFEVLKLIVLLFSGTAFLNTYFVTKPRRM